MSRFFSPTALVVLSLLALPVAATETRNLESTAVAVSDGSVAGIEVDEQWTYCPDCYVCEEKRWGGQFCWWAGMNVVGRCNCTDTATYCAMSGGFCEEIVVFP